MVSIPTGTRGKAILKIKDDGIIAGISLAKEIFCHIEPNAVFTPYINDGDKVKSGQVTFEVAATVHTGT